MTILTVDDYLAALPAARQALGQELRLIIQTAMPEADECIRYKMPCYQVQGVRVIHFAVWTQHVGLYPVYRGAPALEAAIAAYRSGKDSVRFSAREPLPKDLIAMIVQSQMEKGRERPEGLITQAIS